MPAALTASIRRTRQPRAIALSCALACAIWPALAQTPDTPPWEPTTPALDDRQQALLEDMLARLVAQAQGEAQLAFDAEGRAIATAQQQAGATIGIDGRIRLVAVEADAQ